MRHMTDDRLKKAGDDEMFRQSDAFRLPSFAIVVPAKYRGIIALRKGCPSIDSLVFYVEEQMIILHAKLPKSV